MSKRFKGKPCVYCSDGVAITGDHIFAREFFLASARANLPQAPTCRECNNKKSKLEHYLVTVLPFGARHSHARENLATMVPKRLAKNSKLQRELATGHEHAWLRGRGAYLRSIVVPFHGEKLEALFCLIARGLVWYHWQVYLPGDCFIQTRTVTDAGARYYDERLFKRNSRNRVRGNLGNGTFLYEGAQGVVSPIFTIWRFLVYGGAAFGGDGGDERTPAEVSSQIVVITAPNAALSSTPGPQNNE